ncbi:MAG TPA: carbamoyltransferase [Polyangiaceae bacterium]
MPSNRYILGISAFYHDSAAALVDGGDIVAAAQEERFTRKRHDGAFPAHAAEYCLREAGIGAEDLAWVAFYDKPLKKFDRILETYFAYAPRGFASFAKAVPMWVRERLFLSRQIRKGLDRRYGGRLVFMDHHESHAASAFFPSPFERAAILTTDGVGEWATTTWGVGEGNRISLRKSISFPHSLGLLYSAFTYFAGFKVNSGEYKLMGLAPFGKPVYADLIKEKLIHIKDDGSYRLCMDYFTFPAGLHMTGRRFADLFGGPPRNPLEPITRREMDLAASIQSVTEEVMLRCARHVHEQTQLPNLCLAGGVALNCVANGRILREGPFERLWIQPAAGDAGGALGAALFVWHQLLDNPRSPKARDAQKGSLLGPSYTTEEIVAVLDSVGAKFVVLEEAALLDRVADLLARAKIVGWFHGRMEFGPRALGARSLLGDARSPTMQRAMNQKVKFRESFRPFAPCVLRERAHEIFDWAEGTESPYMALVAPVRASRRRAPQGRSEEGSDDGDLLRRIDVARSEYPAITHVDYSARIQTVDEERHGRFYRLMKAFERQTGSPVLVNTSFNVRGEPIVNQPAEALSCFFHTDVDALVLGDCLLLKEEQPIDLRKKDARSYVARFSPD